MTQDLIIQATDIEKYYGYGRNTLQVLKGVSLDIAKGEIVSIVGPSGAGKSTLLNIVGCLDGFQNGSLSLLGKNVSNMSVEALAGFRNENMGFIFQLHNLLFEFTALENVMMPLLIRRVSHKEAKKRSIEFLEKFNLQDRLHHKPSELSGGECQRVAVARAIVGNPSLILADEPTGSLDSVNSRNLINQLFSMCKEQGSTIIIVTHDREIASQTQRTISIVDGVIESQVETESPAEQTV